MSDHRPEPDENGRKNMTTRERYVCNHCHGTGSRKAPHYYKSSKQLAEELRQERLEDDLREEREEQELAQRVTALFGDSLPPYSFMELVRDIVKNEQT